MPNTLTEWLAVWFIIAVIASPLIGRYLANRRIRNELRTLLYTSDAGWAVKHREWIARRRSGEELKLSKEALIETIAKEEAKYAIPVHVVPTEQQKALSQEQSEFNRTHITPAQRQKAIECGFTEEDESRPFALDDPQGPRAA